MIHVLPFHRNQRGSRLFRLCVGVVAVLVLLACIPPPAVRAEDCDTSNLSALNLEELARRKKSCEAAFASMEAAKKPHVDALKKMDADIAAFLARIKTIEGELVQKGKAIAEGEKELAGLLELANKRIRQFYIRSWQQDMPIVTMLSSSDVGEALRVYGYNRSVTNEDKRVITQTAMMVKQLQDRKTALENERASLSSMKTDMDKKAAAIRKLVAEADAYQTKLTGAIAALSAAQQAILTARSGTFTTSVGDVPLADDPNAAPNYSPGFSPAFAGFSFGAYTHRKGMSQYGAKGRAQNGQNASDILKAYYGKTPVSKDTGGTISVQGVGTVNFEDYYLMGIAEMPADFPKEALKAQAIAARSYAWRYKQSGQSICTTQSCQVFNSGKANNPPGEWKAAVQETRGQVIEDVTTYYSSTTGGYSTTSGWDTKCGNQGCWTGDAYEKIAGSPWFYKGWYTADYYNSSGKCGRSHPWLTGEEFADILNAWTVMQKGSDDDKKRVLPVTINSCGISGGSGNPYSMSEMRDRANGLGGAFSVPSSVSVRYSTDGYTSEVIVDGKSIPGAQFKEAFNLRAPGYISIRSPLFNIEKK